MNEVCKGVLKFVMRDEEEIYLNLWIPIFNPFLYASGIVQVVDWFPTITEEDVETILFRFAIFIIFYNDPADV